MRKRLLAFFCAAVLTISSFPGGALRSQAAGVDEQPVVEQDGYYYPFMITEDPQDVYTSSGKTVTFTVVADKEDDLSYQWQVKNDDASDWKNTTLAGAKTKTLSVYADGSKNGRKYRCVVWDTIGNKHTSRPATLIIVSTPKITEQPSDIDTLNGTNVTFHVSATGVGLKYQWQVRDNAEGTWKNTTLAGAKSDSLTVNATTAKNGKQYRCVVANILGKKVNSQVATLYVKQGVVITQQPESASTDKPKMVKFTIKAEGEGLKYQWQTRSYSFTDYTWSAWKNTTATGYNTDTLRIMGDESKNCKAYRCVVTDKYGKVAKSNIVMFNYIKVARVVTQPTDFVGELYGAYEIKIDAEKATEYQWQRSEDGINWEDMKDEETWEGTTEDTLSFVLTKDFEKYQFRVICRGKDGGEITQPFRITWTVPKTENVRIEITANGKKAELWWNYFEYAHYNIYYAKHGEELKLLEENFDNICYPLTENNFEAGATYDLAIQTIYDDRLSELTDPITFEMKEEYYRTTYRALLIGESSFKAPQETVKGAKNDVVTMEKMLNSVSGCNGGRSYAGHITKAFDQSANNIRNLITYAFMGADDDDVSLFYISTLGDATSTGNQAGALVAIGPSGEMEFISLNNLAGWLNEVPGQVIVILSSSGSGAAIHDPDENGSYKEAEAANEAFLTEAINTFAAYGDLDAENVGEFRRPKFVVLCAAEYLDVCYGIESVTEERSYTYFTNYLTQAVGVSGPMIGDRNKDGMLTVNELYKIMNDSFEAHPFTIDGVEYTQHIKFYSQDGDYVLFRR